MLERSCPLRMPWRPWPLKLSYICLKTSKVTLHLSEGGGASQVEVSQLTVTGGSPGRGHRHVLEALSVSPGSTTDNRWPWASTLTSQSLFPHL